MFKKPDQPENIISSNTKRTLHALNYLIQVQQACFSHACKLSTKRTSLHTHIWLYAFTYLYICV